MLLKDLELVRAKDYKFKSGLTDCVVMLAKRDPTWQAWKDFKVGIESVEEPTGYEVEFDWLKSILVDYMNRGKINLKRIPPIPDTLILLPIDNETSSVLTHPSEVLDFINSVVPDGALIDFSDLEFFDYCIRIVEQLEYLYNKKMTEKRYSYTCAVLEGYSFDCEENIYVDEFEWLKGICKHFIDFGEVFVKDKEIPQGIAFCEPLNTWLSTYDDMIDFIKSIRLVGSDDSVEIVMRWRDEPDDEACDA